MSDDVRFERLPSFWGETVLSMRYVAFGPRGELQRWPDSRLRRLWMRLRGWTFVEDSMIENQRRLNYLRATPEWTASVERLSLAEIRERYGEGVAPSDAEKDRL